MPLVRAPSLAQILSCTQQLGATEIQGWGSTSIPIIPAPGSGRIIAVLGMAFVYKFGTSPFNISGSDNISAFYDGSSGDPVMAMLSDFLNGVATDSFAFQSGIVAAGGSILPGDDNQAVLIQGSAYNLGPIKTATLGAGGTGYAVNDTGTITTGSADATYKVLTVGGPGQRADLPDHQPRHRATAPATCRRPRPAARSQASASTSPWISPPSRSATAPSRSLATTKSSTYRSSRSARADAFRSLRRPSLWSTRPQSG